MKPVSLWLSLAAIATSFGAVDILTHPDVVVSDSYFSPDFGELRLHGVCSVSEDSVKCWDPEGRTSSALANEMTDDLQRDTKNHWPITHEFHRKNRFVMFQMPSTFNYSTREVRLANLVDANGAYLAPETNAAASYPPKQPTVVSTYALHADQAYTQGSIFASFL